MITGPFVRASCLGLAAVGAIGAAHAQKAAAPSATRPTIVLVHGAFEDGTAWQHVVSILQRDQHNVVAVQAPLTSLAADV